MFNCFDFFLFGFEDRYPAPLAVASWLREDEEEGEEEKEEKEEEKEEGDPAAQLLSRRDPY